ncbi:MAG: MarR family transcriptional regulator, partial [Hyphomicrobiales bacterium]
KQAGPDRPPGGAPRRARDFVPPPTVTLPPMLKSGGDVAFRETLYLMVLAFGRLNACREAFGRSIGLTASQFIVLIGTAYRQGAEGVSIRALADHTQLAATHVTTEVGRLIGKGLLTKRPSTRDRRSVLVRVSPKGEDAIRSVNPLLRRVNDLLFAGVAREDFAVVSRFLEQFGLNSEAALAEIRRSQRERSKVAHARQD